MSYEGVLTGQLTWVQWRMPVAPASDTLASGPRPLGPIVQQRAQVQWYAGADRERPAGGLRGRQMWETTFDSRRVPPSAVRGGTLLRIGGRMVNGVLVGGEEPEVLLFADDVRSSGSGIERGGASITVVKWQPRQQGKDA